MNSHFLYLAIDLGCIFFPFVFSFDPRTRFYRSWKPLIIGIAAMMAVFIPWDIAFTRAGYWGFNDDYLVGVGLFGLPLEEWLFFICVPYACLFSYVSVGYYFPGDPFKKYVKYVTIGILVLCTVILLFHFDHAYPALTSVLSLLILSFLYFVKKVVWLGRFYLTYLFVSVPFLLVNGVLTGLKFWEYPFLNKSPDGITDMVVWYDNSHNIGWRIFSIPMDDLLYAFLMLLIVTGVYEQMKTHQAKTADIA